MKIDIRVIPRSPRNEIGETRDGRLVVRVTAPPVDSAANEAVVAVLAAHYRVPKRSVRIVSGERSRNKLIEISERV